MELWLAFALRHLDFGRNMSRALLLAMSGRRDLACSHSCNTACLNIHFLLLGMHQASYRQLVRQHLHRIKLWLAFALRHLDFRRNMSRASCLETLPCVWAEYAWCTKLTQLCSVIATQCLWVTKGQEAKCTCARLGTAACAQASPSAAQSMLAPVLSPESTHSLALRLATHRRHDYKCCAAQGLAAWQEIWL